MPDAAPPVAGPGQRATLRDLLRPKVITARPRAPAGARRGQWWRWAIVAIIGLGFWAGVLVLLSRVLRYFRNVPGIGTLLAGKLLGMACLSFFAILLLSNVITALSSFFLSRDLDLIVAAPVDWLDLYLARLAETLAHSSWMVVLMAIPIVIAYGLVYAGGVGFAVVAVAAFVPFFVIPAAIGSAFTALLVTLFPARRTRDILSAVAVLAAAGLVLLFRLLRPEQLVRPEGLHSLVDFIALLRAPTSAYLPSDWVQRAAMGSLTRQLDLLPLYLLWTTAAAAVTLGALVHRATFSRGFTKAQETAERWVRGPVVRGIGRVTLSPFGVARRELVMKELRVFFRDTTQWSQLLLLAVLVVVYIVNVKLLPLHGGGVTFFLVNTVPFLNLGLSGFVLASIAARFIFPAVSLEGRTLWLLRSSPLSMRALLWAKYWTGTLPLLGIALAIVGITDALMKVSAFIFVVSVLSITLLTFAVAGLALGLGALFPQFETENAAQIPTSFGGLVFMILAVALVGSVVVLEAGPVYGYLATAALGAAPDRIGMVLGFSAAAALCLTSTFVPLRLALRRLEG